MKNYDGAIVAWIESEDPHLQRHPEIDFGIVERYGLTDYHDSQSRLCNRRGLTAHARGGDRNDGDSAERMGRLVERSNLFVPMETLIASRARDYTSFKGGIDASLVSDARRRCVWCRHTAPDLPRLRNHTAPPSR